MLTGTLTVAPARITGGTSPTLSLTLPAISNAASATLGDGTNPVQKPAGGAYTSAELLAASGSTLPVAAPTTSASDDKAITYTLTVFNADQPPLSATATGTLTIVPQPVLTSGSFTLSPNPLTSGYTTPLALMLPGLSSAAASASAVTFQSQYGATAPATVTVVTPHTGPVTLADLGQALTVDPPYVSYSQNFAITLTLTVSNSATTPATAQATATLNTVAQVQFSGGLQENPGAFYSGSTTAGLLKFPLPTLYSGVPASVSFTATESGTTTSVTKSGGGVVAAADLGTTISVDPPSVPATSNRTYTYTLSAQNSLGQTASTSTLVWAVAQSVSLSGKRIGGTATLLANGKVLLAGGGGSISQGSCSYDSASNTADLYDRATGTVTAVPGTMSTNRCRHTAVLSGGKVYLMGGASSGNATLDRTIDVYDSTTNTFQSASLPSLVVARTAHTASLVGTGGAGLTGKVVVAGGYDASGTALTSLELFDPATGSATSFTHGFVAGRAEHTATQLASNLIFIGGNTADVESIDLTTGTSGSVWRDAAPTNSIVRIGAAAAAISTNKILVVGGLTSLTGPATDSIQVITFTGGVVSSVSTPQHLATARARFPMLSSGSRLYVFGGTTVQSSSAVPDTATSGVEQIDVSGTPAASTVTSLATARQAAALVSLGLPYPAYLVSGGNGSSGTAEVYIP